ncbi:hypothetical protein A2837_00560 [Candidatus Kaiserbacteria bacterium RIFCSPHIGHO2_01_FULL_46_22]|uniref:Histidyl-tRNA synthetase n=1 Tax=Candidatus Kaiserbacteria bacterium RIFCSPHIGHO2_01_FULL_46_22 TaxID=1798475 RepID=A0A1F6BXF0_9BACT|nr:MAG: hypothetical protein A2837_00560 [Candidatus Kaiserbacteria bacterium RIFCSPHIGHO2_01_FULL_46_22]
MEVSTTEFTKRAVATCEHFGFRHQSIFRNLPECKNCTVTLNHNASALDKRKDGVGGLIAGGVSAYADGKLNALQEPVFYYNLEPVARTGEVALSLHIFGVEKSIAEAILIQTIRSLLQESGLPNQTVRINSLGDNDSQTRYTRELTNFLKRRVNDMPKPARELMKEHSTLALQNLIEENHPLVQKCPSPLEHLTDQSRRHFREIVEYLDMSETPYEIDPRLFGHYHCWNDAIFTIDQNDELGNLLPEQPFRIQGGRYSSFFERHSKTRVPAVGAVVILQGKRSPARLPRPHQYKPNISIIQLGFGPKVRSLLLIDQLRKAGINLHQDLASDSLSAQLRAAEARGTLYTIIIGQKEYVDGTVILRDMLGRNQESVLMSDLPARLKKIHTA